MARVLWQGQERLGFEYMDANGTRTYRDLEAAVLYKKHSCLYLMGWSRLRLAKRTFRADRIVGDVVNRNTGEVGSLVDVLSIPESELAGVTTEQEEIDDDDIELIVDFEKPPARIPSSLSWGLIITVFLGFFSPYWWLVSVGLGIAIGALILTR